jgi:glycosyltransferase involved in cell wall biosynthesis
VNILLTNSTDIYAGGEDYVLTLAKYLGRRGHNVAVSALPDHLLLTKCRESGITTVPIDYRGMDRVFAVSFELRRQLKRLGIEVVHSNANYDRTCAAMAAGLAGIRHVAGVHSTHSIQHNITHWLRNRYGTDHFIADADAGKEVLVREDGIPPERVTTVPIGIEDPDPELARRARIATRKELGVGEETLVVGNVARLVPFKGHRVLLDAVAEVVRTTSNVLFPIVGDGELLPDLQEQASRLGIGPHVRFLGFREDLEAIYPAFDIYCHSSLDLASEMFPIAILRSLAAGLPVVCTDVGGIAAMVNEGLSGHLVKPDDPAALAAALLKVAQAPGLRIAMGRESRRLFEERYHAAVMAERIERVYLSAFGRHAHSGQEQ